MYQNYCLLLLLLGRVAVQHYVDAAYCYRLSNVVCRSVWDAIWVEDSGGLLDRESISPCGKGQLWGEKGQSIVKYRDTVRKNSEPIEMPFGLRIRVGPRNRVTWGAHWRHLEAGKYDWTVHIRQTCKNGWTNWDAIWGVDSRGPRNHVLDGCPNCPMPRGNF